MPVPAGLSLPMMMFSLRPRSWSRLPSMAASVSTRVVSWRDAAVRHLGALVHQQAAEVAGGDREALLAAVVAHDRDRPALGLVVGHAHVAGGAGQHRLALGGAGLEELDHPGQAVGDVLAGDAAG